MTLQTRAEKIVITQLLIGHTKATKSYILSRWLPTICHNWVHILTIGYMVLGCVVLQETDSCKTIFETILGYFCLISTINYSFESVHKWCNFELEIAPHLNLPLCWSPTLNMKYCHRLKVSMTNSCQIHALDISRFIITDIFPIPIPSHGKIFDIPTRSFCTSNRSSTLLNRTIDKCSKMGVLWATVNWSNSGAIWH